MTLKYEIKNQVLHPVGRIPPTVELSRNVVFLELSFDEEWSGAAVTILFSNDFVENGKTYQKIWNNDPVPVPTEVLETGMLRIGCVGLLDGGETRITTARMERGVQILRCGGIIGVDPAGETPELWEQLLASMGQLGDLQTEDKSSLVAAINEVLQFGGSGSVDPADIAKAVEDYLSANPIQEQDPTVPAWAKEAEKPSYTAQEVGADPSGTAAGLVAAHNTAESAHNDIRLIISGLTQRLNALADSDDTTLDQLSEVVAYIKANRELIASITTDKVSVSDIINNLTTNVSNKPLSAAQGVALKALIDAISIPEKLPSPNALTFTGAATGSYDGSKPLTVDIPSVSVDDSLTQSGQAADAAKVGEELRSLSEEIPTVFDWAKKELFDKADLVDPAGINSFLTIDGVEYYRYNCGPNNFEWNNPKPYPGSVTITARAVSQYGGTNGTRLLTIYDDGTYGPSLFVIVGGESKTVTVTTDPDKTLAKITGNYDMENWALLDMSVMSCVANYNTGLPLANSNAPGGVIADPATEEYTVPAKIGEDGKMYVPDMSGGGGGIVSGDYIPVPSTAEVGQTIRVSAVDENGKPTAWEAVDMASGGGEVKYDYEKTIVLEEDAASITIDTFDDGTPLSLKKVEVVLVGSNATSANQSVVIIPDYKFAQNGGKIYLGGGSYYTANKWSYLWGTAEINDGEISAEFAMQNSQTRYTNYYCGINSAATKVKPSVTFSFDKDIFPVKATKFISILATVATGSFIAGTTLRIRGVKA